MEGVLNYCIKGNGKGKWIKSAATSTYNTHIGNNERTNCKAPIWSAIWKKTKTTCPCFRIMAILWESYYSKTSQNTKVLNFYTTSLCETIDRGINNVMYAIINERPTRFKSIDLHTFDQISFYKLWEALEVIELGNLVPCVPCDN